MGARISPLGSQRFQIKVKKGSSANTAKEGRFANKHKTVSRVNGEGKHLPSDGVQKKYIQLRYQWRFRCLFRRFYNIFMLYVSKSDIFGFHIQIYNIFYMSEFLVFLYGNSLIFNECVIERIFGKSGMNFKRNIRKKFIWWKKKLCGCEYQNLKFLTTTIQCSNYNYKT